MFMGYINICVILCITICSLEIPSALTICFPHSRLLNQFQFAVSALVQKSKIGRRNPKSSSLALTVATVVGDHLQGCWCYPLPLRQKSWYNAWCCSVHRGSMHLIRILPLKTEKSSVITPADPDMWGICFCGIQCISFSWILVFQRGDSKVNLAQIIHLAPGSFF